jgi:N-methylhydantoinase A
MDRLPKMPPLVASHLRFEVAERLDQNGNVVKALTDEEVERVVAAVRASGVSAVAVCLIHGYRNAIHEQKLGQALQGVVPNICLSHVISPEIREYERTNTTVISAAVLGRVRSYLATLDANKPGDSALHFFHSSGGMASPKAIGKHPLLLAMSGPAAGVGASVSVLNDLGVSQALTFDMGGTTTDACLVVDGKAEISSDRELGDRRIRLPMVAVHSIGAGGGSIARLDNGALTVGPTSAGSFPGPACYGLGGKAPTVSDANMVLGYLNPARVLGKTITLSRAAAAAAIEPIAKATGVSLEEAAVGILEVANSNMTRALNRVTVERGVDGRECTLVAFGGGGPMHASFVASQYGIQHVIVPGFSSGFSALGCVSAAMSYSEQRTINMRSVNWHAEGITQICDSLRAVVCAPLQEANIGPEQFDVELVAMIRYSGQSYDIPIPAPRLDDPAALGQQFFQSHEALYGFVTDEAWELTAIRAMAKERAERPVATNSVDENTGIGARTVRQCFFAQTGRIDTPVYERLTLAADVAMQGPAIVEDEWSTIVIPPGDTFKADGKRNIHIHVGAGE